MDLSECLETIGEREQYQGIYPEYYWSLPARAVQTRQPAIRVDLSFFSIYWKFKMWASKRPKQSLPVDGEGNMLTDSWVSTEPQPSPAQPLFPHLNHAATNRRIVFFNSNHNCWNIMHLCTSSFQSITGKFEADKAALRTYFVTIKASYLLPLVTAHSASSKLVDLRYGSTFYWIKYPHGWQNAHTGPWLAAVLRCSMWRRSRNRQGAGTLLLLAPNLDISWVPWFYNQH